MFEDELRHQLLELCATTGAVDARIVRPQPGTLPPEDAHRAPLGGGAFLDVVMPPGTDPAAPPSAAIERTVRALRACARRWDLDLPVLGGEPEQPLRVRIIERIERFLGALTAADGATNALVTVRGKLIGSAAALTELHRERIDFLLRRMDAEVSRQVGQSSHGELVGDDFFAISFWYGACLIVFFDRPFSVDFARHRSRMVARELAGLLPDLDDPPRDPARVAPVPES
jgi:hypothetical protein